MSVSYRRRILYGITRSETGGAQNHVRDLLDGLRDHFDLALAVGEEGPLSRSACELGARVHILPSLIRTVSPQQDCRAIKDLVKLISSSRPDLVHLHSTKAGFLGRIAAKISRIPSVFTAHGWAFEDGVPWLRKLVAIPSEWFAARCCERIIAVSQAGRFLAHKYRIAPANKINVVYYGIPDSPERARPDKGEPLHIVMVARFANQKDHTTVLRAAASLSCDFRLVFVGDGPTKSSMEAEARSLSISDRVDFLGDRSDVPKLLAASHVFVLGTHWEGLPISILEAMRAGLPVVASDVGGVREEIVDGETGFVVPSSDAEAMYEKLGLLVAQPELRVRMGSSGRRRFEEVFSITNMIEKTKNLYDEVLGLTDGSTKPRVAA